VNSEYSVSENSACDCHMNSHH